MKERRQLILAIAACAAAVPFASFSQQKGKTWRVGYLSGGSAAPSGFLHGMRELGYIEGKNLLMEWRFAEGEYERLSGFAAELVNLRMDVIVTADAPATSAAQKATSSIPIVMASGGDPVGSGFVRSLAQPGGNITGVTNIYVDLGAKHLELLLGVVPKLSRVAFLMNPGSPGHRLVLKSIQTAAQKMGAEIISMEAQTALEIANAFFAMYQKKVGAVIVPPAAFFSSQRRQIVDLAATNRLVSIGPSREYAEAGGLMAYGTNSTEQHRRAATFVDKIFKGAKTTDLPVEQPMTFEMVVNLKTAKALGVTMPPEIMVQATRVIQ